MSLPMGTAREGAVVSAKSMAAVRSEPFRTVEPAALDLNSRGGPDAPQARAKRYCPITPIAFNHASASGAQAVAVEAMRRNPNACPPFAKTWISEGTPALRSTAA